MFKNFFITLIFGLVIGLSTAVYMIGLDWIQAFHQTNEIYPYFLILVFALIYFIKRNTLYFPTSVHQVINAQELEQKYWSRASYPANLIGSWLSHAAGASLGREGTVLVLTVSLAQVCQLNWNYFKPIILSAALACVMGQPWIALVIILELFTTSSEQKLFSVLMAWVGVLVLQTLNIPSLFTAVVIDMSAPWTSKLAVVASIGFILGIVTLYYKKYSLFLFTYFKQKSWIAVLLVLTLTALVLIPALKPLHSLSLAIFPHIQNGEVSFQFILLKIILTLLFTSLGFIGGDFVPSILIGSAVGVAVAQYFQVSATFGFMMGLFSFFVGVSRLKWTGFWMIFLLAGWSTFFWAYLVLSVTRYLSGPISFYTKLSEEP